MVGAIPRRHYRGTGRSGAELTRHPLEDDWLGWGDEAKRLLEEL
jgi:hypothetical protein